LPRFGKAFDKVVYPLSFALPRGRVLQTQQQYKSDGKAISHASGHPDHLL
jgi:hypothetical protein